MTVAQEAESARVTDEQAVANLLARYAETIDGGDFAGLGTLFADGLVRFEGDQAEYAGRQAVAEMYTAVVQLHGDSPLTRHVMTNFHITIDEDGSGASARSYFTVFQDHPDLPLQPIAAGHYIDRFGKVDGRWAFSSRTIAPELIGDLGVHVGRDPYDGTDTTDDGATAATDTGGPGTSTDEKGPTA